ncbi:MAG: GNAT family N-acetyltransferase [Pseudohongiella sp.]|uniref:GNAT family N-acetyltransferase n=1 Tax=Pseudohongiella sp. TaxID=1979412 RepID=UPI00349FE9DB
MIRLHPIDPSQKPAYWQLYKRCYEPTIRAQFGGWDDAGHYKRFLKTWQNGHLRSVQVDGQWVGCLGFLHYPDRHELLEIQIDPDYQNRGIASQLIQWLIEQAQQQGKPLYLNVFLASAALRLYQRLGFKIVGSTRFQHRMVYRVEPGT